MKRRIFWVTSGLGLLVGGVGGAWAGAFAGASAVSPDTITHPMGYGGTGGEVVVSLCIDPTSANAAQMEVPLLNAIYTYNTGAAASPNWAVVLFPDGQLDFESVLLHDIGHCMGLGQVNLSALNGANPTSEFTVSLPGSDGVYSEGAGLDGVAGSSDDVRGDDVNLHWFRMADNNPFVLGTVFDSTTMSRDLADLPSGHSFAVNADRTVAVSIYGVGLVEAVMQDGHLLLEAQRDLMADDVSMLRLAGSGVDEIQGTADDYTLRLHYVGRTTNCDIVVDFDDAETALSTCDSSLTSIGSGHMAVDSAAIYFNSFIDWHFNDTLKDPSYIFRDGFESGDTTAWSTSVP